MDFKMKSLSAVVLSAGLMVGGMGVANAGAIALAHNINDGIITKADGSALLIGVDIKDANITDEADTLANLNGVSSDSTSQFIGATNLYDVVGTGAPDNDIFTSITPLPTELFSVSDTKIDGNLLAGGVKADTYGAVSLLGDSYGSTQQNTGNITTVQFLALSSMDIKYAFSFKSLMTAWVSDDYSGQSASAFSSINVTFKGTDIASQSYSWNDTISTDDSIWNVVEKTYSEDVTLNASVKAGEEYKLTISTITKSDATSVPEPTSLALLGLGLLGFGAAKRRKA